MEINWIKIEPGCKLPKYGHRVLLTIKNIKTKESSIFFGTRVFMNYSSCISECISDEEIIFDIRDVKYNQWKYKITAWAVSPEPYKEDE